MKSRVVVLSKPEFNQALNAFEETDSNVGKKLQNMALISINDTSGNWTESFFDEDHENVLRLWFDDVERDGERSPTNKFPGKAFTDDQADKIMAFVIKHEDKDFMLHCAAGISRSGVVGKFVNNFLEGDHKQFMKANPRVLPNARVSKMLNSILWKKRFKDAK